jgi:hypothetical protein
MVHLLVHIVNDITHPVLPTFLHNMMLSEIMNEVVKGYVRNMSHVKGSVVQGFLTEECISFCTNYIDVENHVDLPENKHHHRFEGLGHKTEKRVMHVDLSGLTADFDRANLVALQHIDLVHRGKP